MRRGTRSPPVTSTTSRLPAAAFWPAAAAIAALGALCALHRLHDLDILWHLRTGEWILAAGEVPRTDPFGGRTAGIPWLDVAWGFQAMAAALAGAAGGLFAIQIAVVALVGTTLLGFLARAPRTPLVLAAALLSVLAAGHRFLIRPDILAFPLTLAAMALVERLPGRPRSTTLLLGLLTAAWANLHGSFVLVPLLVLTGALGAPAAGASGGPPRRWGLALLVAAAAPALNPRGVRIYEVLLPYARSMLAAVGLRPPADSLLVSEWTPTWRAMIHDAIFPTGAFVLLALLLALSFLTRGGGLPATRLACALALLALALTAVRNVLPFGAAALFIVARNERDRRAATAGAATPVADPFESGWFRAGGSIAVLAVAASYLQAVATDRYYVDRDMPVVTGAGIHLDLVPEGAVQWLAAHQPPGRLFNNYNSGAYVLHRLGPEVPTYIDARFDVTAVNREIEQALRDPAAFDALVERDGIGTILLLHPSPESLALLPRIAADARWTLAFRDANSTIHVRSDRYPPARRAAPLALPPAVEPAALRLNARLAPFKRHVLPAAERTDAFVSSILGDHGREREAWRRALERAPGDPKALAYFAGERPADGR